MNMKRLFIGAAALLISFTLVAEVTTGEDAKLVANGWLKDNASAFGTLGAFKSVRAETDANGATLWHWVIFEKGAAILAPDTEIEPVIAVLPGCDGTLPANHPMRALLMRDLPQRLAHARAVAVQGAPANGGKTLMAAPKSAMASKWARLKKRGEQSSRPMLMAAGAYSVERPATIVRWLDGWNEENDAIRCWTQEDPFNMYTPLSSPFQLPSVVGCVATAGASVLHYFRIPGCDSNIVSKCTVDKVTTEKPDGTKVTEGEITLATKGGVYDWSLFDMTEEERMALVTPPEGEGEEVEEVDEEGGEEEGEEEEEPLDPLAELVGRVSYDVGVLSHMNYTFMASGAFGFDLATALRKHFSLPSARYVNAYGSNGGNTSPIDSRFYPNLVYNQIRAGSPVIFGIQSTATAGAGHEVVACGYGIDTESTDYTYIFCGWAGTGDAWYALPHIDTKATTDGSAAHYDVIGEMITMLSTNSCTVPLVGRIVDIEGVPVTNACLKLSDGTEVRSDTNGYWAVRIDPSCASRVIYDPVGDPHAFKVGDAAFTPGSFTDDGMRDAVSAQTLAESLPEEMEIVIDRAALGKEMALYGDYEPAARQALAEGKLLYVLGGTDEAAVKRLLNEFRTVSNDAFRASCVFWQVNADQYRLLADAYLVNGLVDPRVFDPYSRLSADNGAWAGSAEDWSGADRRGVVSLWLTGEDVLLTDPVGSGKYTLMVAYKDDKTNALNSALADWSVDDATKASVSQGRLMPVRLATGSVTVTAEAILFGEPCSADKAVVLSDGPCRIVGGCRTNTCVIALDDEVNVTTNAILIAQNANSNPGYNRSGDDPVVESIYYGNAFTFESNATYERKNRYVFRCVGLELNGENVADFDGDAGSPVRFACAITQAVNRVGWIWKTEKYYVAMNAQKEGGCKLDQQSGYYFNGSNLVVSARCGTGVNASDEWVTIWRGCDADEVGVSNATVKVDRIRDIYVWAVNLSDDSVTNTVTVAETNGLKVAKGFKIELVSVGEDDYGDPLYNVKVVRHDSPEPEFVEPGPIAFTSIEKVDGEWVLVATNATQWCEYSLVSGTAFPTNSWEEGEWAQSTDPTGPITYRVPVADDEPVRFWVIRARPGEKPAE